MMNALRAINNLLCQGCRRQGEDEHEDNCKMKSVSTDRTRRSSAAPPGPLDLKAMPKIELHAHLSGSIRRETLHDIWAAKTAADPNYKVPDPLLEMPVGKDDWDLDTFFPLFNKSVYNIINDLDSIKKSTLAVLQDFQADNVVYLELRTTPRSSRSLGDANYVSPTQYISTVCEVIQDFCADSSNTMIARLILSIDRRQSLAEAEATLNMVKAFGSTIVGLDLCGDPKKGDVSIFTPVFTKAKQMGLGVTVHFAEIAPRTPVMGNMDGESEVLSGIKELELMLSWNPDRLGHAIHIPTRLKDEIRERHIALELCLTCNVKAKMLGPRGQKYSDHHFKEWFADGSNPIVLGTDDSAIFLSTLSQEYELARKNFKISDDDLKDVACKAVEVAFVGEEVKEKLRAMMW